MKKVLIVDDSRTIRRILRAAIGGEFNVYEACGADQAFAILEHVIPDVAIVDVHLGGMDGIELIQAIRKNPIFAKLPILVLSTESDKTYRARARKAGATAWITKPFEDHLITTVLRLILKARNPPDTRCEGFIGHPNPRNVERVLCQGANDGSE